MEELTKQEGSSPFETKILSFGEILVGIDFDEPTDGNSSDRVKELMAQVTNILTEEYKGSEKSPVKSLLFDHAIGELISAQMAVVKVITFKN